MDKMDDIVLVTTFYNFSEAAVIESLLKSNGIECELIHSNMAQLYPGNPAYTIQLMARKEDLSNIEEIFASRL